METMKLLLPLDLQFFSADFDEFDLEAFDKEFEESTLTGNEDDSTDDLPVEDEPVQEELETETEEEDSKTQEPTQEEVPDLTEEQKRNAAFAQLRRERDAAAKRLAWLENLAKESGMTVEQLQEQYEQRRLQKEAEQKGVSVEVLQRLQQLEQENTQTKEQLQAEKFNAQVKLTLDKYKGTEENVSKTFEYAQQNGLVDALRTGAITFEAAYKLAHMDTMLEEAKQSAVQEDLSKRKQRQQEAPIANGSGSVPIAEDLDAKVKEDAKSIIENGGF